MVLISPDQGRAPEGDCIAVAWDSLQLVLKIALQRTSFALQALVKDVMPGSARIVLPRRSGGAVYYSFPSNLLATGPGYAAGLLGGGKEAAA